MKLSFSKTELLKGINIVLKAVSSKTTMPILKCILINAEEENIKLFANDMELAITTVVEGNILEKGSIALEARIFSEIARRLPEGDITIETNERMTATITCGKSVFSIPGQDPSEFPPVPDIEKEVHLGMSQFTLKEMIRQTIFSLNINENNKLMTGELFELKNNALRMVALDGHRIAIRKIFLAGKYEDKKVIVPGKTLGEVGKILSDNLEDQLTVYFSKNHILFEFDDTCVYSRLIEGDYFHVDNMLGGEPQTKIKLNKKDFNSSLERSELLIKEGENKPIILEASDGIMDMKINTALGSMHEDIQIEKEGSDIRIGFNPKFIIDALKVIDDEEIDMYMINQKAPCFIKNEDETYLYLILPVNIL